MEYKKFGDTYVVRLDPGEEVVQSMLTLAAREKITLAHLRGLGAVNNVTLKSFRPDTKQYAAHMYHTDLEIVSLNGNLTTLNGRPYAHCHMSVADAVGHVYGGHLNKAVVSSTCEIFLNVVDGVVERKPNAEIGLNIMTFAE
jgi:predicted DNA-binding protein with PD1-like motif